MKITAHRPKRRRVLIRTDSGGGTHEFLTWLTRPGRRLAYSAGFTTTQDIAEAILQVPARAWTPAYDADGQARPGAWVAELTGMLNRFCQGAAERAHRHPATRAKAPSPNGAQRPPATRAGAPGDTAHSNASGPGPSGPGPLIAAAAG